MISALAIPNDPDKAVTVVQVNERNATSYYPYVSGGPVEGAYFDLRGHALVLYVNSRYADFAEDQVNDRATVLLLDAGVGMALGGVRGGGLLVRQAGRGDYERSLPKAVIDALDGW